MANKEKISELIDDNAFAQLEKLIKMLGMSQDEFERLAKKALEFNSELSKAKTVTVFNNNVEQLAASTQKLTFQQQNQAKIVSQISTQYGELSKKARERLAIIGQDEHTTKRLTGTLDQFVQQQVKLKLELAEVRDQQKLLTKEYAGSDEAKKKLQSRTAALAKQEALLKAAIQQSNTEIRRAVKEQNAAEGSIDELESKLLQLTSAFNALSKEERENVEVGGVLLANIQDLDAQVKALKETTGDYTDSVGNYQRALENVGGPLGGFIDQLKSAYAAAQAFVATPIGAALAAISGVIAGAKAWYDYNAGLVEATRLTKQLTGLGGDDLKAYRTEVQATAKTFDKDFKDVLNAANSVSKQFGVSLEESLSIINKGFIAGADASDDFLAQLKEYPALLKEAGLNAEQTAAIITQSVQEGIYSDKGIDAIKEAGIRLRELTPATRKALDGIGLSSVEIEKALTDGTSTIFEVVQKVSTKLNELPPQSAAVGAAIADVFGGPGEDAGLRYLQTLDKIDLSLDNLVGKQGEIGQAQQKQLEATEKLEKAFSALFDTTGGGFELMIANGKLFLTDVLLKIINGTIDLVNYTIDFYNQSMAVRGVIQLIGAQFRAVWTIVAGFYKFLFVNTKNIASLIKAALTGNFSDIGKIVQRNGKENVDLVTETGKGLADAYIDGWNNTVNNKKISRINPDLTTTGASSASNGTTGGLGGNRPPGTVDPKEQKKLIDAELALSEYRATVLANNAKRIAEDDKASFDSRIKALDDFKKEQEKVIEIEKQIALSSAENANERVLAEEKAVEALAELDRAYAAMKLGIVTDQLSDEDKKRLEQYNKNRSDLEVAHAAELAELDRRYLNGEIKEKEYAQERLNIQHKYNQDALKQEIQAVEDLISVQKARGVDTAEQERKLAALKIKLSQDATAKQIEDLDKLKEEEKKLADKRKETAKQALDIASQVSEAAFSFDENRFERENQKLEEDLERIDKREERERQSIENSALSEEEKSRRIQALEERNQAERERIEQQQRQNQIRQARFDKTQAIVKAAINTAVAVTAVLPNFVLAAIVGAMGALQVATIAAKPIPQYFRGTDYSAEGFAHVGERGQELVVSPDGQLSITPPTDTIAYLQKGSKVFTAHETKRILAKQSLPDVNGGGEKTIDWTPFIHAQKESTKELKKAFAKQQGMIITKKGLSSIDKASSRIKSIYKRNIS